MKKRGESYRLKADRIWRGLSRSMVDRERQQIRAGNPRPQFWWIKGEPGGMVTALYQKAMTKIAARKDKRA